MIHPRDRRSENPRSFYVRKDQTGEVVLRNRRHIRRLPEGDEAKGPDPVEPGEVTVDPDILPVGRQVESAATEAGQEQAQPVEDQEEAGLTYTTVTVIFIC